MGMYQDGIFTGSLTIGSAFPIHQIDLPASKQLVAFSIKYAGSEDSAQARTCQTASCQLPSDRYFDK